MLELVFGGWFWLNGWVDGKGGSFTSHTYTSHFVPCYDCGFLDISHFSFLWCEVEEDDGYVLYYYVYNRRGTIWRC